MIFKTLPTFMALEYVGSKNEEGEADKRGRAGF